MLTLVLVCAAAIASVNAGYASSSSGAASSAGGAGLYNTNSYNQVYSSRYPYSNSYTGYANQGGYVPSPPFQSPHDFQNAFQQYYNSIAAINANLFRQQFEYQAALQNSIQANLNAIRDQAYYASGAGYGNNAGSSYASTGGSTGTYGGVSSGQTYGGTYGGRPNYAAAGGSVGNGYQHQHASVYPANPARPNLDSRFGDSPQVGVSHSTGPGGFVGVSSFSSSSDINGHKNRESGTSVNNNGKVTNYYTRNK